MDSRPSDLLIPQIFTDTYSIQSVSVPAQGIWSFGVDPATQSYYALSRYGDWQVRKTTDHGVSWTIADSFQIPYGGPRSFVTDDLGNLFVSGNSYSSDVPTTIVRKSSDHGLSWLTVGQFPGSAARDSSFVPGTDGGLFIVGYRNSGGNALWTVRRSRDRGQTWAIVDSFSRSGKSTQAAAIACGPQRTVYVAGFSSPDPFRWELRVSENGGESWLTVSPPNATAQFNGTLNDMAIDAAGNLFLVGTLDAWAVVRRNADGVWQDAEFPFGTETGWVPSSATAVTLDRIGNAFVAGWVRLGGYSDLRRSLLVQCRFSDPPLMSIETSPTNVALLWTAGATNFVLEAATSLLSGGWDTITNTPTVTANERSVQLPVTGNASFFRLRQP